MKKMILVILMLSVFLVSCSGDKNSGNPVANIYISIDGSEVGTISVELYPETAKNTVDNFISLADSGFYNGLVFHRVISGFMIQGGDPLGNGTGGPRYAIKGEFTKNGFENDLSHERGVISMARSAEFDSAGSQFFICHADAKFLDGEYAAFGKLISGEDVLDKVASVQTGAMDKPVKECTIDKVEIEFNGYEKKEPEIIK